MGIRCDTMRCIYAQMNTRGREDCRMGSRGRQTLSQRSGHSLCARHARCRCLIDSYRVSILRRHLLSLSLSQLQPCPCIKSTSPGMGADRALTGQRVSDCNAATSLLILSVVFAGPTGTRKDPPLTAYGVAQSKELAAFLRGGGSGIEGRKVDLLFSSPF